MRRSDISGPRIVPRATSWKDWVPTAAVEILLDIPQAVFQMHDGGNRLTTPPVSRSGDKPTSLTSWLLRCDCGVRVCVKDRDRVTAKACHRLKIWAIVQDKEMKMALTMSEASLFQDSGSAVCIHLGSQMRWMAERVRFDYGEWRRSITVSTNKPRSDHSCFLDSACNTRGHQSRDNKYCELWCVQLLLRFFLFVR